LVEAQPAEPVPPDTAKTLPDTTGVKVQPVKDDCETARLEGEKEGEKDANSIKWFFASFLGSPLFGTLLAFQSDPGMPREEALKNTQHRACFTLGYRTKKKDVRERAAVFGGVICMAINLYFWDKYLNK